MLAYDGDLPVFNPTSAAAITPAELHTLVERHHNRMLNVGGDVAGFAKRVAVARAADYDVAITAPNVRVLANSGGSTSSRSSTMYYIDGDVFVEVHEEEVIVTAWCPPRQGLIIPTSLVQRALVPLSIISVMIDVAPLAAVHNFASIPFKAGARLVAGSLGMSRGAGQSLFWAFGEPHYTTMEQFAKDCHVWCEDKDGRVWDIYSLVMKAYGDEYGAQLSVPHAPTVMRCHTKIVMARLGFFYKAAPKHMQRQLINRKLQQCAQKLRDMPVPEGAGHIERMVLPSELH